MEREGVTRVKMFFVITVAYLIFWGPLFLVTLLNWDWEWVDAEKSWAHDVSQLKIVRFQCFFQHFKFTRLKIVCILSELIHYLQF